MRAAPATELLIVCVLCVKGVFSSKECLRAAALLCCWRIIAPALSQSRRSRVTRCTLLLDSRLWPNQRPAATPGSHPAARSPHAAPCPWLAACARSDLAAPRPVRSEPLGAARKPTGALRNSHAHRSPLGARRSRRSVPSVGTPGAYRHRSAPLGTARTLRTPSDLLGNARIWGLIFLSECTSAGIKAWKRLLKFMIICMHASSACIIGF